ncbi:MAG: DNA methyltransferase [Thermoanaerobaculia bacterium]
MIQTSADQRVRELLAEFEGTGAKGQGLESVSIHPFPARMPCAVAEHLIEQTTQPGATVLDPMVGSGTTLVAARRQGRLGVGFDRDPLAVLVSRATTQRLSTERVEALSSKILERAKNSIPQIHLSRVRGRLPEEDQQFLRYWFPPRSQKQLFALAAAIEEEPEGPERDLSWVVFSSLIIAKSAGASFALDISRSRPHKNSEKRIVLPFDGWARRFKIAIARHPFLNTTVAGEATVHTGDARSLPLEEDSVDLVLTSPPYLNAIDYLRAHKFSLVWMGHDLQSLRELRGTMMGTERGLWSLDGLPQTLEEQLEVTVSVSRWRAILRQYLSDLRKVLAEAKRVLRPEGLLVLVVGPSIVAGEALDAVTVVSELGSSVGLRYLGSAARSLNPGRRSLPPPSQAQEGSLDKRMQHEVLIALRK